MILDSHSAKDFKLADDPIDLKKLISGRTARIQVENVSLKSKLRSKIEENIVLKSLLRSGNFSGVIPAEEGFTLEQYSDLSIENDKLERETFDLQAKLDDIEFKDKGKR